MNNPAWTETGTEFRLLVLTLSGGPRCNIGSLLSTGLASSPIVWPIDFLVWNPKSPVTTRAWHSKKSCLKCRLWAKNWASVCPILHGRAAVKRKWINHNHVAGLRGIPTWDRDGYCKSTWGVNILTASKPIWMAARRCLNRTVIFSKDEMPQDVAVRHQETIVLLVSKSKASQLV